MLRLLDFSEMSKSNLAFNRTKSIRAELGDICLH